MDEKHFPIPPKCFWLSSILIFASSVNFNGVMPDHTMLPSIVSPDFII